MEFMLFVYVVRDGSTTSTSEKLSGLYILIEHKPKERQI